MLVFQRNECIQKMDGDWILFIDSDMAWQPGAIKTLIETQAKFDLDIVGGLCFQRAAALPADDVHGGGRRGARLHVPRRVA